MLDYNPTTRITAMDIIVSEQFNQYDYQKHPYFESIDFSQLQYQKPPYVPPFTPLPIIYDDVLILDSCYYNEQELENELNILRGSFDATYKEELEIQKEGKSQIMNVYIVQQLRSYQMRMKVFYIQVLLFN